jgi:hypothetical protein
MIAVITFKELHQLSEASPDIHAKIIMLLARSSIRRLRRTTTENNGPQRPFVPESPRTKKKAESYIEVVRHHIHSHHFIDFSVLECIN